MKEEVTTVTHSHQREPDLSSRQCPVLTCCDSLLQHEFHPEPGKDMRIEAALSRRAKPSFVLPPVRPSRGKLPFRYPRLPSLSPPRPLRPPRRRSSAGCFPHVHTTSASDTTIPPFPRNSNQSPSCQSRGIILIMCRSPVADRALSQTLTLPPPRKGKLMTNGLPCGAFLSLIGCVLVHVRRGLRLLIGWPFSSSEGGSCVG